MDMAPPLTAKPTPRMETPVQRRISRTGSIETVWSAPGTGIFLPPAALASPAASMVDENSPRRYRTWSSTPGTGTFASPAAMASPAASAVDENSVPPLEDISQSTGCLPLCGTGDNVSLGSAVTSGTCSPQRFNQLGSAQMPTASTAAELPDDGPPPASPKRLPSSFFPMPDDVPPPANSKRHVGPQRMASPQLVPVPADGPPPASPKRRSAVAEVVSSMSSTYRTVESSGGSVSLNVASSCQMSTLMSKVAAMELRVQEMDMLLRTQFQAKLQCVDHQVAAHQAIISQHSASVQDLLSSCAAGKVGALVRELIKEEMSTLGDRWDRIERLDMQNRDTEITVLDDRLDRLESSLAEFSNETVASHLRRLDQDAHQRALQIALLMEQCRDNETTLEAESRTTRDTLAAERAAMKLAVENERAAFKAALEEERFFWKQAETTQSKQIDGLMAIVDQLQKSQMKSITADSERLLTSRSHSDLLRSECVQAARETVQQVLNKQVHNQEAVNHTAKMIVDIEGKLKDMVRQVQLSMSQLEDRMTSVEKGSGVPPHRMSSHDIDDADTACSTRFCPTPDGLQKFPERSTSPFRSPTRERLEQDGPTPENSSRRPSSSRSSWGSEMKLLTDKLEGFTSNLIQRAEAAESLLGEMQGDLAVARQESSSAYTQIALQIRKEVAALEEADSTLSQKILDSQQNLLNDLSKNSEISESVSEDVSVRKRSMQSCVLMDGCYGIIENHSSLR